MQYWKKLSLAIGWGNLITAALFFYLLFTFAYLDVSKSILILINNAGEATLELIMLIAFAPFSVYSIYYSLKNAK